MIKLTLDDEGFKYCCRT